MVVDENEVLLSCVYDALTLPTRGKPEALLEVEASRLYADFTQFSNGSEAVGTPVH